MKMPEEKLRRINDGDKIISVRKNENEGDGQKIFNFFKTQKGQWIVVGILLLMIIISSSAIRLSNLPLLKDQTTGEYIPLALDPFYFLRVAETIVDTGGDMSAVDPLRSPSTNVIWHEEILSKSIVGIYHLSKTFNPNVTIQYIDVISPVIFFIIGMVIFFFLCYVLLKRKSLALLATALLAYVPSYLYRTMAGFSDHEAIGMIAIFSFFLVYALALKNFEKSWKNVWIYSILSGFMTAFVLTTWGGAITFVLTTMPFAFFMYWFFLKKDDLKSVSFYGILLLSSVLCPIIFGYHWTNMLNRFLGSYGLLVPFVLVFILIDFGISRINKKKFENFKIEKYQTLYSLGTTILLGLIGLRTMGKSIPTIFRDVWVKLINPFGNLGGGRLGSTVAENAQPYLVDWIGQSGKFIFWLFVLGVFIVGINFALNIRKRKSKYLFIGAWIIVVSGILFSRISASSSFEGTNFISQSFYLLSLVFFGGVFLMTIINEKFKVDSSTILILSILFFTLINGRSAIRVFFLIAPFVALSTSYVIGMIYDHAKVSKEEISRIILWGLFILAIILTIFSLVTYYQTISNQSKYTGPSANAQWQSAMEWTRNNTDKGDVFVHWWDYGYWIQSLGKRPTVTDGGHSGGDQADHYIGRYVLTTPNAGSALSYMKTWNVSYLLIDQTDLGKYPAYSSIGGGAEDTQDRYASIPVMVADPKQIIETANGTVIIYQGGMPLFEDVLYEENGKEIFLPSGKAAVIGLIVKVKKNNQFEQPQAVYVYNGVQTKIPIRYVYYNGALIDFKNGLDAVIDVIPSFDGSGINPLGSAIYLSQKVSKSLFAQLFLLDDAFGNYPTIKIAHTESDQVIKSLRNSGYKGGEFLYYQGFRGPIKIWGIEYNEDVKIIEEFKEPLNGVYAKFDGEFY